MIGWFFRSSCLRLLQSSFLWIISVGVISGIVRKWNRSDSSDSDCVEPMTPLATPIFDFHYVGSALTIPTTTPTPSPVKTSLNGKGDDCQGGDNDDGEAEGEDEG